MSLWQKTEEENHLQDSETPNIRDKLSIYKTLMRVQRFGRFPSYKTLLNDSSELSKIDDNLFTTWFLFTMIFINDAYLWFIKKNMTIQQISGNLSVSMYNTRNCAKFTEVEAQFRTLIKLHFSGFNWTTTTKAVNEQIWHHKYIPNHY